MSGQHSEMFKVWALRLAIITTFLVVLLSWLNGVKLFDLIVRAGVSFGVMYLLLIGFYTLFERTAPPKPQDEQPDSGRGGFIDISVGDDQLQTPPEQDARFPGQVDKDLSEGLPNSERQAEIVRRMGWE
ncbi:hypothetical protein [Desulfosporosinus sp. OT]|uniref:hypothetical protein n=1 Tax=Desulfosporosinus sp. OT TaxID=913865 RepID=UPI000223B147|nr:hypothetical protein [Desulfosporosinus sp. OT]EGW36761.1 hypothetical protein DOT_5341 [Desulfosporosinus sp. OT]